MHLHALLEQGQDIPDETVRVGAGMIEMTAVHEENVSRLQPGKALQIHMIERRGNHLHPPGHGPPARLRIDALVHAFQVAVQHGLLQKAGGMSRTDLNDPGGLVPAHHGVGQHGIQAREPLLVEMGSAALRRTALHVFETAIVLLGEFHQFGELAQLRFPTLFQPRHNPAAALLQNV